jgi:hypothetical protein
MEVYMGRFVALMTACVLVSASLYGQDARRDAAREMDRILSEMSQKRHEREMQRRQQEHERAMAELAAQQAQQASAAKPPGTVPQPSTAPAPVDPILSALVDPANYTQNMPNGRVWSALDPFLRRFYISAATDGVRSVRGKSPFAIAAVTAFYEETGRTSIPITYVVKLVALKATNAPNLKAETQAVLKQFSTWDVSN